MKGLLATHAVRTTFMFPGAQGSEIEMVRTELVTDFQFARSTANSNLRWSPPPLRVEILDLDAQRVVSDVRPTVPA